MKVEANKMEFAVNYEKIENKKVEKDTAAKEIITEEKNIENKSKNVEEAVEKINKHLEASNTKLKFKIHDSSYSLNNKVSIKVVDEESEKVIAEIPSEEAIELSERMHQIIGFLFDKYK